MTFVGEADNDIRKFAKDRALMGESVIILSDDASLILGLPSRVKVASQSRLSLRKYVFNPATPPKVVLFGSIPKIGQYCSQLGCALESFGLSPVSRRSAFVFFPEDLLDIAALLGGEHTWVDHAKNSSPFDCVEFASDFLLQQASPLRNEKKPLRNLLVAAALVAAALQRYTRDRRIDAMDAMMCGLKQTAAAMIEIHQDAKKKRYQNKNLKRVNDTSSTSNLALEREFGLRRGNRPRTPTGCSVDEFNKLEIDFSKVQGTLKVSQVSLSFLILGVLEKISFTICSRLMQSLDEMATRSLLTFSC